MTISKNIISSIINEESNYDLIKDSIDSIYAEFYKITNIVKDNTYSDHGTILKSGEALTPQTAAGCIYDYVRTTKFLRGVYKALNTKINLLSNRKVKLLYAGSGPFASLVLPLLPLFKETDVEIDIIDFHKGSIDAVNTLISHYGYEKYFDKIIVGDATEFNSEDKKYDIIISETMRNALSIEPQVAISLQLYKFLAEDGIFLPEKISVTAVVADLHSELSTSKSKWQNFWLNIKRYQAINRRIVLGDVFILEKNVREKYDFSEIDKNLMNLETYEVPKKLGEMKDLIFLTTINIFDDIVLSEQDNSGLTKVYFDQNTRFLTGGEQLKFQFLLGPYPKVITSIV